MRGNLRFLFYPFSLLIAVLFLLSPVQAQMGGNGRYGMNGNNHRFNFSDMSGNGHHGNHDSLKVVTVSGTVIIDTTFRHLRYFLNVSGGDKKDYFLNFGPWWYSPEGSDAERPNAGDEVTITGGLVETHDIPMIIVYKINGLFWRDPFRQMWHRFGRHYGGGRHWGWFTNFTEIETTGVALIDSQYMRPHYFLDADYDSLPDYRLNFGPPWYNPISGAKRPDYGDTINIKGALMEADSSDFLDMIIVGEINGLKWRNLYGPPPWGGRWIHHNATDTTFVYCSNDSTDMVGFPPGAMHDMMHPDSIFFQIFEMEPWEIPGDMESGGYKLFAGYMFSMFNPQGWDMMDTARGGVCNFQKHIRFQFHYDESMIQNANPGESVIVVMYWDESTQNWVEVPDVSHNIEANVLSFNNKNVGRYYGLFAKSSETVLKLDKGRLVETYSLFQNYPNPFNAGTEIRYYVPWRSFIKITIFDITGREVTNLVNGIQDVGFHEVYWNGLDKFEKELPSGVYFYSLKSGDFTTTRKLVLIR